MKSGGEAQGFASKGAFGVRILISLGIAVAVHGYRAGTSFILRSRFISVVDSRSVGGAVVL